MKKEILAIVLYIQKFQVMFLINFFLQVDCKSAEEILQKGVQNIIPKQFFLDGKLFYLFFNFEIEFIKESSNV